VAQKCYLPANSLMLDLLNKYPGEFKVSFSISGIALEQFQLYAPEVLESFKKLADTGQVEFLSETYAHSLSSLHGGEEFKRQVLAHREQINTHFGQDPKVFRNTELIYSDSIGAMVADMGFKAMLTEGAKHVLGWKSPNYLYCNAINPKLKLLLKNFKLSDDIAFRFSNKGWGEYPLTADKFVDWLNQVPKKEEVLNLFMDYETFGEHQWKETGIFDFLAALPGVVFKKSPYTFSTPSEVADNLQVIAAANVPHPISWADEERDLTAWLGNEMQQEAFNKLYSLSDKVYAVEDKDIKQDFTYLQVSDHFYYMSTKFFSDGEVHSYFNPYHTPYDAFINYMNILSDFEIRVNAALQTTVDNDVARLSKIIKEKDEQLMKLEQRLAAHKDIPDKETKPVATKAKSKAATAKSKSSPAKKGASTRSVAATKKAAATKRSSAPGKGKAAKK
jgi:alpha-amylase